MRLILPLLLISFHSYSQIERTETPKFHQVAELRSMGRFIAELKYSVTDADTLYCLLYNNEKYSSITDVQSCCFNNEQGTIDTLYSILTSSLEKAKGERTSFKLGANEIWLVTEKSGSSKYIMFINLKNNSYFNLNRRQIQKLFGK